jgi:hypothetical protein
MELEFLAIFILLLYLKFETLIKKKFRNKKKMNWKTIENYPNYEISDCGLVMNSRGWILKSRKNSRGYLHVSLCKNGKPKSCTVHRLVAQAFIENHENKREIDHIDRCRTNNHVDNLRWATNSENGQNKGFQCNNKLGIKNIHYDKRENTYIYKKNLQGKRITKSFKTLEEAIEFRKSQHCSAFEYASAPKPQDQHFGNQMRSV